MIGEFDIAVNAENPGVPLKAVTAFVGSPTTVRVANVPRAIGKWAITSVSVTANYPDNTSKTATCRPCGGIWVGTILGSSAVGRSANGFQVTANGIDENGQAVTGYVLGKGDVEILSRDGTITVGDTTYYVHLLDSAPTTPHKGDLCKIDGVYKLYDGSAWVAFGGGGGTPSDYETVKANAATGATHAGKTDNPHGVTAAQVGADAAGSAAAAKAAAIADAEGKYLPKATVFPRAMKLNKSSFVASCQFGSINVTGAGIEADGEIWVSVEKNEQKYEFTLSPDRKRAYVDGDEVSFTYSGEVELNEENGCVARHVVFEITANELFMKVKADYWENVASIANEITDEGKSALFAGADFSTSANKAAQYPIKDIEENTLKNATMNTITPTEAVTLAPPTATVANCARDWLVVVTQGTTAYGVTFTGSFVAEDGFSWPTMAAGKTYVFAFTEVSSGVFMVACKEVANVA